MAALLPVALLLCHLSTAWAAAEPEVVGESAQIGQTSATLQAELRPEGAPTSYRFEYVPEARYESDVAALGPGHGFDHAVRTPESEPIGEDTSVHRVSATAEGLAEGTTYLYRVLATSSAGADVGEPQRLTSLDAAGLPDGRGVEMVSPPDLGPVGTVGPLFSTQFTFAAAPNGDEMIFPVTGGLGSSTAGGEPRYLASRTAAGWSSTQLSPPSLLPTGDSESNPAGRVDGFSEDLGCGTLETFNPIDSVPPVATPSSGVTNLFLYHRDGPTELLTVSDPENPFARPSSGYFHITGMAEGCRSVLFETNYRYPGFEFSGAEGLYEWSEGRLRNPAIMPDGSEASSPIPGGSSRRGSSFVGALSANGRRVFFSAPTSEAGHLPGSLGVFARVDGVATIDVSRSTTAVPDTGATFEAASSTGSRVFFLANYGLTSASSSGTTEGECTSEMSTTGSEECDLYEYNLERGQLTDLTATADPANPSGAAVAGVLGLSTDGSSVYLAAKGRLVPGRGNTYAENVSATGETEEAAYNIYLSREASPGVRSLSFVGVLGGREILYGGLGAFTGAESTPLLTEPRALSSRVTPGGGSLLFVSRANVTGYKSEGQPEAYLYSAGDGTTRCVSCRPDGEPPVGNPRRLPLILSSLWYPAQALQPRALSDDGGTVFFTSPDVLAPGGITGNSNLYEWREGAVALLHTEAGLEGTTSFIDAGASGNDVFVVTADHLLASASGQRERLYDLRVGGGFAEPPLPPSPCQALSEGSCQSSTPGPPGTAPAPSSTFTGPGNQATPPSRCAAGKTRRRGRCVRRHQQRKHTHKATTKRGTSK
ncbi:MAG: hypothetical protein JST31_05120 [Actinobacteria bacterium]|nr:hypothetical protein [Actinomycetota bacterium]